VKANQVRAARALPSRRADAGGGSRTATFFEVEFNMTEAISNNGENSTVAIRNEAVARAEA